VSNEIIYDVIHLLVFIWITDIVAYKGFGNLSMSKQKECKCEKVKKCIGYAAYLKFCVHWSHIKSFKLLKGDVEKQSCDWDFFYLIIYCFIRLMRYMIFGIY